MGSGSSLKANNLAFQDGGTGGGIKQNQSNYNTEKKTGKPAQPEALFDDIQINLEKKQRGKSSMQ